MFELNFHDERHVPFEGAGAISRWRIELLAWALRCKLVIVAAAVLLFVSSLFVFTRLGAEFIPQLEEGTMKQSFDWGSFSGSFR